MIKIVNGEAVQMLPDEIEAWKAKQTEFNSSTSNPAPHKLYKSTLVRRLTEQEAVTLTELLEASPVKSKMLWEASDFLMSGDPLFSALQAAITGALGKKRADEILEAE